MAVTVVCVDVAAEPVRVRRLFSFPTKYRVKYFFKSFFILHMFIPFLNKLKTFIRDIHMAFIHHSVTPIIHLRIRESGNISGPDMGSIQGRGYQFN
jgi:hypothetical protein